MIVYTPPAEPLTIRIAFDAGQCAPNRLCRLHWRKRGEIAAAAKEAGTLAWRQAGSPVWNVPVIADWTIRRGRRLDPNSLVACLKWLEDALFVGRITPDDSETWYGYGKVRQETRDLYRFVPSVEVVVTPRHAATTPRGGDPALLKEIED